MKATLEFNLDDVYERAAHMRAISADKMAGILFDLGEYLIRKYKYTDAPDGRCEELAEIQEKYIELFEAYDLSHEVIE